MKTVAFLVYPDMAVLDFTGPDTALSQHFKMKYVWKDKNLVQTENKHSFIQPTHTFDEIKDADILCYSRNDESIQYCQG
ncbi:MULTISPECIES: type 1 glutamine amidotransferase family protein [Staphylococcaceae]|uniref:hypothetical protein n=1 Tax=Staphylococcaceae TaxID=90964 RepID=UPI001868B065|nr:MULTISPECIES: hypothetical protein [Staphylococcaceae]